MKIWDAKPLLLIYLWESQFRLRENSENIYQIFSIFFFSYFVVATWCEAHLCVFLIKKLDDCDSRLHYFFSAYFYHSTNVQSGILFLTRLIKSSRSIVGRNAIKALFVFSTAAAQHVWEFFMMDPVGKLRRASLGSDLDKFSLEVCLLPQWPKPHLTIAQAFSCGSFIRNICTTWQLFFAGCCCCIFFCSKNWTKTFLFHFPFSPHLSSYTFSTRCCVRLIYRHLSSFEWGSKHMLNIALRALKNWFSMSPLCSKYCTIISEFADKRAR